MHAARVQEGLPKRENKPFLGGFRGGRGEPLQQWLAPAKL